VSLPAHIFLFLFMFPLLLSQSGGVCDCLCKSSLIYFLCFFIKVVGGVCGCAGHFSASSAEALIVS
jgi:hypothetical protein